MGLFHFSNKKNFSLNRKSCRWWKLSAVLRKPPVERIRCLVNKVILVIETNGDLQKFFGLKMQDTDHRNAVLLYIAMKSHEVALFADEGIYKAVGATYWNAAVKI